MIRSSPKQFKDISSTHSLSLPTLSRRLDGLQELNIVTKEPIRYNGRSTHCYNLTGFGEKWLNLIVLYEKSNESE